MLHVYNNVTLHLSILYYHTNTNITKILYYIIIASTAAKYTNNNHQQQSQSPAEAEVPVFIVHVLILNICQHTRIALKKTYTSNGHAISFFVSKNVMAYNTPPRPYICISEASLTSKSVMWIQGSGIQQYKHIIHFYFGFRISKNNCAYNDVRD